MTDNAGRKDDTGKLRYDLIPPYPLERLAEVYTIGAKKYADRNWEKGLTWGRVFAAMMRHAWAWWRGERTDKTDGQHHLASVAWCAFALMEYQDRTWAGQDDRPSPRALSMTRAEERWDTLKGIDVVTDKPVVSDNPSHRDERQTQASNRKVDDPH